MVLLVLALIWGALLVSWLRSRSVSTFSDSVGTFRRHLTVLERTTPTSVRPANRLRVQSPAPYTAGAYPSTRYQPRAGGRGPVAAGRPGPARRPVAASPASLRRRQAQKRRRDVLFALLAGTAGSLLLAMIPGLSMMWAVQVIFDLLLGGYVALLVRLRNLAAERELKLRFMPANRTVRARTHDYMAGGYGDLELSRAVN